MKKRIKQAISHPLISGSIVIFAGTLIGNFLNFLFTILMGRTLSVADYGVLLSLNSLILVFALVADSLVPTIVHFTSTLAANKEEEKIHGIFFQANKIALILGTLSFLIFASFSKVIGNFFNINNNLLVVVVGVIVFFCFMGSLNRAILQARLMFKYISFMYVFSTALKLILGIMLVFLGFRVFGALYGFLFSFVAAYVIAIVPLRTYFKRLDDNSRIPLKSLLSYGAPTTVALFGLTFFINTDIILVKHFFSPEDAGVYAALSVIGRVIFFFSAPIATVMFPLIVQKHTKKENFTNTFKISIFLVFILSSIITVFYFVFPRFAIKIFYGQREEFFAASSLLPYFGIFITIYSLLSILTNFFLSIKKTKIFIVISCFAIIQMVLIWFNHSSFSQVLTISIVTTSLPLIILLLYYIGLYERKTKK